jgi:hypothetical protein
VQYLIVRLQYIAMNSGDEKSYEENFVGGDVDNKSCDIESRNNDQRREENGHEDENRSEDHDDHERNQNNNNHNLIVDNPDNESVHDDHIQEDDNASVRHFGMAPLAQRYEPPMDKLWRWGCLVFTLSLAAILVYLACERMMRAIPASYYHFHGQLVDKRVEHETGANDVRGYRIYWTYQTQDTDFSLGTNYSCILKDSITFQHKSRANARMNRRILGTDAVILVYKHSDHHQYCHQQNFKDQYLSFSIYMMLLCFDLPIVACLIKIEIRVCRENNRRYLPAPAPQRDVELAELDVGLK